MYLYVPSNREKAQYAYFNYRLGVDDPVKLTSSAFHQYKVGIAWGSLPQTFQDAINVTYQLVLKYVWIDSLCIVQDDSRDWCHEGSRTAAIYLRAFVPLQPLDHQICMEGCLVLNHFGTSSVQH